MSTPKILPSHGQVSMPGAGHFHILSPDELVSIGTNYTLGGERVRVTRIESLPFQGTLWQCVALEKLVPEPVPQASINWTQVKAEAHEAVLEVHHEGHPPKDFEDHLTETVMITIYGPDFYKWWNKRCQ